MRRNWHGEQPREDRPPPVSEKLCFVPGPFFFFVCTLEVCLVVIVRAVSNEPKQCPHVREDKIQHYDKTAEFLLLHMQTLFETAFRLLKHVHT